MGSAICVTNLIDATGVTITPSSELPTTPAQEYLRAGAYEHVLWRWIAMGDSASLLIDHGQSVTADTFAQIALTGEEPTIRLRLSLTDPTAVAAEVLDTTDFDFDPDYLPSVHLSATPRTFRYELRNYSEAGVASIGAGRLVTSLRDEFAINFEPGFSKTPVRRTVDIEGEGGQTFTNRKRGRWRWDANFGFMNKTDYRAFVRLIDVAMINDGHKDFLFIEDVDSDHLAEDSVWGFQPEGAPTIVPFTLNDVLSKRMQIVERL